MRAVDLVKGLGDRARAAQRLFDSEDGRLVLEVLEREYLYGQLVGDTPEQTFFNLGCREVVLRLRTLRDHKPTGDAQ